MANLAALAGGIKNISQKFNVPQQVTSQAPVRAAAAPSRVYQQPSTGGGGSWGGQVLSANTGGGGTSYSAPAPSSGGQPAGGGGYSDPGVVGMGNINPDYSAAMGYFEQMIPGLQQSAQDQQTQTANTLATQKESANQQFGAQGQQLETAKDESRRQASEILQGIQGRYGGTTGEGSFASALTGQGTQQTIAGINQKIAQVHDVQRIALNDLEDKAGQQINAAKQWLTETLNGIRSQQGTLEAHKADLAYGAMQNYQNYLQQVNMGKQQLYNTITAQAEAAKQQLNMYLQLGWNQAGSAPQMTNPLGAPQMGASQQGATPGYVYDPNKKQQSF